MRKVIKAWADVGSGGGIFEFVGGPVSELYPSLLHIFSRKVTSDLKEVEIRFVPEKKKKRAKEQGDE